MDGSPTQPQPPTSPRNYQTLLLITAIAIFIVFLFLGFFLFFSLKSSRDNLIIADQTKSVGLSIQKLVLSKGGFLIISATISPRDFIFRSEYLPPGVYANFDIPNFILPGVSPQTGSFTMTGFVYEDTNGSRKFEDSDNPASNIFGKTISSRFILHDDIDPPLSCSHGLIDDFSGNGINRNLWYAYLWNQQKDGHLIQTAQNNIETNGSTILYSKNQFEGDLTVEVQIASYTTGFHEGQDYKTTAELTLFTLKDRVASIKWIKSNGASYLEPNIGKLKNPLNERYDLPFDAPLKLKIVRIGSMAVVYVATSNSDYQKLWDISDISTDNLHVGFESYDFSSTPTLITSVLDNFSVSCQ